MLICILTSRIPASSNDLQVTLQEIVDKVGGSIPVLNPEIRITRGLEKIRGDRIDQPKVVDLDSEEGKREAKKLLSVTDRTREHLKRSDSLATDKSKAPNMEDGVPRIIADMHIDHAYPATRILKAILEMVQVANEDPAFKKVLLRLDKEHYLYDQGEKVYATKRMIRHYGNCLDNLWYLTPSANSGGGKVGKGLVEWMFDKTRKLFGPDFEEAIREEGGVNYRYILPTTSEGDTLAKRGRAWVHDMFSCYLTLGKKCDTTFDACMNLSYDTCKNKKGRGYITIMLAILSKVVECVKKLVDTIPESRTPSSSPDFVSAQESVSLLEFNDAIERTYSKYQNRKRKKNDNRKRKKTDSTDIDYRGTKLRKIGDNSDVDKKIVVRHLKILFHEALIDVDSFTSLCFEVGVLIGQSQFTEKNISKLLLGVGLEEERIKDIVNEMFKEYHKSLEKKKSSNKSDCVTLTERFWVPVSREDMKRQDEFLDENEVKDNERSYQHGKGKTRE